eukprot:309444-Pyramimonas_sp.AAC.2
MGPQRHAPRRTTFAGLMANPRGHNGLQSLVKLLLLLLIIDSASLRSAGQSTDIFTPHSRSSLPPPVSTPSSITTPQALVLTKKPHLAHIGVNSSNPKQPRSGFGEGGPAAGSAVDAGHTERTHAGQRRLQQVAVPSVGSMLGSFLVREGPRVAASQPTRDTYSCLEA